ncbi:hypothetical protein [Streptomyces gardneri]|uniref:hypothetical protein n=1 Tax=Streptomyces gardneri TaxID=66892 RepID=UPI0035D99120
MDKTADILVAVGRRVFVIRIDSGLLDWRKDYSALTCTVADLPNHQTRTLRAYLDQLVLPTRFFDLAVDQAGDYWWLELNPNGQWGWLEESTKLPMAAALADLLAQGQPPDDRFRLPTACVRRPVGERRHPHVPQWQAAVEAVPRELFLNPGVFLPVDGGCWLPVTAVGADPAEWAGITYRDQYLTTQLDGHFAGDETSEPVTGAQLTRAASSDGTPLLYLFDMDREFFAQFLQDGDSWTVRQGGPVALWDDIGQTLTAWQDAGSPDITAVRLHVADRAHTWIGGQKIASGGRSRWIADNPALR